MTRRWYDDIHAVEEARFLAAKDELHAARRQVRPWLFAHIDGLHIVEDDGPPVICQGQ